MDRAARYKLDNVGTFYSAQAGRPGQTVFRFSAEMADVVDPDMLQLALDDAIKAFPEFNVTLKNGFFWHYLEQSSTAPKIHSEKLPICFDLYENHSSVLFRVGYYRNRINVEVSHIISDGRGTLEFFKAIVGFYANRRYGAASVLPYSGDGSLRESHSADSYSDNYERKMSGPTKTPKAYKIPGRRNKQDPVFIEYHLPADAVQAASKALSVSVTSFVIATIMDAIRETMPPSEKKRAICMDVPVDLRRFFGSYTSRNFFGLAFVSQYPSDFDNSLQTTAMDIQYQITAATNIDTLKHRMNRMIKLEKNPFLKIVPLFVKDKALSFADRMSSKDVTATASSLGRLQLSEEVAPYVRGISVLTTPTNMSFAFCTFENDLCIGISSVLPCQNIMQNFMKTFSDLGINGYMMTNKSDSLLTNNTKTEAPSSVPNFALGEAVTQKTVLV